MILFDVNVLIYAHREDQPDFSLYRGIIEGLAKGSEAFGLTPLVAGGFLRVTTQSKFPNGPAPLAQAIAEIDNLMALHHCHWVQPGKQHWKIMSELCRKESCTGKLVADAQHAALAIEHAATWITRDKDFERFRQHGLRLQIEEPS